jgi:glycogen debranching enzyme
MPRLSQLIEAARQLGKPTWRPMLTYVAQLHGRSIHPAQAPFPYAWEEIGPGYCYGPAFGHWDLIHAVLDVVTYEPEHARRQLINNLAAQEEDGLVPGSIWMPREGDDQRDRPRWSHTIGHPPVWPLAVEAYVAVVGREGEGLIARTYDALIRQIRWFENHRRAEPEGFFYADILSHDWESGIDESVRFQNVPAGEFACVDASSHLYMLYAVAEAWGARLGTGPGVYGSKAARLAAFIQEELFCDETGFFHDSWAVDAPEQRPLALEGMWPVVVGAATEEQAQRVIDENLLNPERFFTQHPVATVGVDDPRFELRMWRGPTWNSMTYWAARGCLRYQRPDAARQLLERALDASAVQFERTGTVWEFYHPHGGDPEMLERKPHTPYNRPCVDYLGHNPLIAMAQIYQDLTA